ncbi:hypothetical protein SAMN05518670_6617 [Paenibacillus sp. OK076]|nr:hypothetical protein SAMN05518670_6617 [Paenibacillus sp. OK076]
MKKPTSISSILQYIDSGRNHPSLLSEMHYVDVARKFTVYKLYLLLAEGCLPAVEGISRMGIYLQNVERDHISILFSLRFQAQLINYFSNNNSVNKMQRMLYSFAYAYYPHLTC